MVKGTFPSLKFEKKTIQIIKLEEKKDNEHKFFKNLVKMDWAK